MIPPPFWGGWFKVLSCEFPLTQTSRPLSSAILHFMELTAYRAKQTRNILTSPTPSDGHGNCRKLPKIFTGSLYRETYPAMHPATQTAPIAARAQKWQSHIGSTKDNVTVVEGIQNGISRFSAQGSPGDPQGRTSQQAQPSQPSQPASPDVPKEPP